MRCKTTSVHNKSFFISLQSFGNIISHFLPKVFPLNRKMFQFQDLCQCAEKFIISLSQNFLHCLALGQLIHQLVQIPNLLHQRILNQLHLDTTDAPFDQPAVGMQAGASRKKSPYEIIDCIRSSIWPQV